MSTEPATPKILFQHLEVPHIKKLSVYREVGGYKAAETVLKNMKPDQLIEVIKKSGLRGRGGAGFPTGMKWGFVPKDPGLTTYLLCNGDESEPGTFKDRIIMERLPHLNLEGIIIGSYAIGARKSYIYIRGEYTESIESLETAIEECKKHNLLGKKYPGLRLRFRYLRV